MCKDRSLLKNTRRCRDDEVLMVMANGGNMINDIVGEMKLFSIDFYYNKCSPANIVSLHRLLFKHC